MAERIEWGGTPGPWATSRLATHSPEFGVYSEAVNTLADLARVNHTGGDSETLRNAAAIALVPEMVTVLRWAERELTGFQGMTGTPDAKLAELRAILAAIDGEG